MYRFGPTLRCLGAKADLERLGLDSSFLKQAFNITDEDVQALHTHLELMKIDGFHRQGAVQLLKNSPMELVTSNTPVDWEYAAQRHPEWITLDK